MASAKSMTDIAYDILSRKKRAVQFNKLWEEVSKLYGASNDRVAQFYSDMTLDSRFASLKDNKWDLIERRKFNESHVDISAIELDSDDETEEEDQDIVSDSEDY